MAGCQGEARMIPEALPERLPPEPLIDRFGRRHTSLRISVTDRCNLRCLYCMPEQVSSFMPTDEQLTFDEIERFVRLVLPLGVNKFRLTGGEPLLRPDLIDLVRRLACLPGVADLSLTTNGVLLSRWARPLYEAGLRRLNVSLDALSPEPFARLARRPLLDPVLAGIEAARQTGFAPIKINAVAMRGVTEDQIIPFAEFACRSGCIVRFIEYMPLDADNAWEREKVLTAAEILRVLTSHYGDLSPVSVSATAEPASDFTFAGQAGRIGFIPSVSAPFCSACNRFRLTADGRLRNCLFSLHEHDVKSLLRRNADDAELLACIRQCIADKWAGHQINAADFVQPNRPMYAIGG